MSTEPDVVGIVLTILGIGVAAFILMKVLSFTRAVFQGYREGSRSAAGPESKKPVTPAHHHETVEHSSHRDPSPPATHPAAMRPNNRSQERSSPLATGNPTGAGATNIALPSKPARIFICYRREDTQGEAGRLYDGLTKPFGEPAVFMDIDSVPLGVNFVSFISEQLQHCSAVLVMIGRNWTTITDQHGQRRLENAADHVRVEIALALKQQVPLIPVLVQNASMPHVDELPDDIRPLAFYNGLKLSPEFWRAGVERLIKELDRVMKV
jgi:hypothetical protein